MHCGHRTIAIHRPLSISRRAEWATTLDVAAFLDSCLDDDQINFHSVVAIRKLQIRRKALMFSP
jgi:hypothetical protein